MASVVVHLVLASVLTGLLACQAAALVAVLRSRRTASARRPTRAADLVWVTIPVAVVLFLAARSWVIALDAGSPAMAVVALPEVAARQRQPLPARAHRAPPHGRPGATPGPH